ncbi:DUF4139 domain-containing protein [Sphingomonas sp. PAMC 26605]|uniref:DUF4139 domain-containing protein n=1 Tax=Sphingomonas sp. PAMC 26605 TaxID=1112214 RepID=UPI001E4E39E4|nr:hypothetical protein [Sphingomonas sp. PAMC 26605]
MLALLLGALLALPAGAQIVSSGPDTVAVTIYRAPDRSADTPIDRSWLRGYALITERRRVSIPAGRTTLRFEGVAAGILPESAIVTGLPNGVREKNLDADLLSPRSLYSGSFGRPVTIRRTIAKRIVEEPAIIRSGPDGAAILQTRNGFVAVDCEPGREALVYDHVPANAPARPTLSVALESPAAANVTVTLSYLAWGFDWQADYVATVRPDGRTADLFAWLTLASSDTTRFADAEAMVVAGNAARDDRAPPPWLRRRGGAQTFECFPHPIAVSQGVASRADSIVVTAARFAAPPPPAPPPPPPPPMARQEDLGDLKLYRVPGRTTVAALAQKQVAMLARKAVPIELLYTVRGDESGRIDAPMLTLRVENRKDAGLGVALPAGRVAVLQPRDGTSLLIGEGAIADKAIGERVEARIAPATQVTLEDRRKTVGGDGVVELMTVRNANPHPIQFEARLDGKGFFQDLIGRNAAVTRKDGALIWAVTVPANGAQTLSYSQ